MDTFEDVDIDSPHHFTQSRPYDGQDESRHAESLVNNVESHGPKANPPGAKKSRFPSEEACRQAFTQFYAHTGTPYPCSQNDLDLHNTGTFQQLNNRPFVSAMEATRQVMLQNHIPRRIPPPEPAAIQTLRRIVHALEKRTDFGPDLPIEVFADLDLVFFGKMLRDNVRVRWAKEGDHPLFARPKKVWGLAKCLPEQGQCLVILKAGVLLRQRNHEDDPLGDMLGVLLHEMCHACEFVRCARGLAETPEHDNLFGTRIAVVHQRAVRVLGVWAIGEV